MEMTWNAFIDAIVQRTGLDDRHLAEKAAIATVTVLGERLPRIDVDPVAEHLPARLAAALRAGDHQGEFDRDVLFERVARLENVPIGRAIEHATVVCQVIADSVDAEGHRHLIQHLPADLASLFDYDQARPYHPPAAGHTPHRVRDLAHAEGGSRNPIATGRPPAHEHSVAREDNPHGDSKLSSGATGQQRHGETLARGEPGSGKPISDSRD
jgi:uncharacterized protein (DUF2267 family)